jgi:anaerobic carbon-monoxide dehydrogenase iron sulfur subunit
MNILLVVDRQMCTECQECINACKNEHGAARAKTIGNYPVFCLQCPPEKAPCARICAVNAIKEEDGVLVVDEEACIKCLMCITYCPWDLLVLNEETKSVQKCTLCMDSDGIIPACVEACKDNALKICSTEDLEDLK